MTIWNNKKRFLKGSVWQDTTRSTIYQQLLPFFNCCLFLRRKLRCSADCSVDPCCAKFTVLFPCGLSCLSFHVLTITASLLNPQVPSSAEVRSPLPRRGVWMTTLALHAFNVENPDANSFGCYWHRWIPGTLWHAAALPIAVVTDGRGHAGVIHQNRQVYEDSMCARWIGARNTAHTQLSLLNLSKA